MAKFLQQVGGRLREALTLSTSRGTQDADRIVSTNANGQLDQTLFPTGVGAEIEQLPATEAIAGGDFVNIHNNNGAASIRKADATAPGKEANGFVLESVSSGATGTVYREGLNNALSNLTPGTDYYLSSTTAGKVVTAPPTASGAVVQFVGRSSTASKISFEAGLPITLA